MNSYVASFDKIPSLSNFEWQATWWWAPIITGHGKHSKHGRGTQKAASISGVTEIKGPFFFFSSQWSFTYSFSSSFDITSGIIFSLALMLPLAPFAGDPEWQTRNWRGRSKQLTRLIFITLLSCASACCTLRSVATMDKGTHSRKFYCMVLVKIIKHTVAGGLTYCWDSCRSEDGHEAELSWVALAALHALLSK